jgi:hypothetical protein
MQNDRKNTAAVLSQRADACRSTAIHVQQPQFGGFITKASRKIRHRWTKRDRGNAVTSHFELGDAHRDSILESEEMPTRQTFQ